MSTNIVFEDPALEALRRKFFPRVPWGAEGPVRRRYLARAVREGQSVASALEELALEAGFIAPGGRAAAGDGDACLAAFRRRREEDTLVFGLGLDVCWCDLALGDVDGGGWQMLIVRSEEAENLAALAHAAGRVRFRKI